MKILVTAGGTNSPIDRGRSLSSVGNRVAGKLVHTAWTRGHDLTVLTSTPEPLADLPAESSDGRRLSVVGFESHEELLVLLPQCLAAVVPDAVVSTAVVGEYASAGVYVPSPGTFFNARTRQWEGQAGPPTLHEAASVRGPTVEPEQWVRLVRTPRVIERARPQWGYAGLLVIAKLLPEMPDARLFDAAEQIRGQAGADLMAVSTFDGEPHWAFVGPTDGKYERVPRRELAERLVGLLEQMHRARAGRG